MGTIVRLHQRLQCQRLSATRTLFACASTIHPPFARVAARHSVHCDNESNAIAACTNFSIGEREINRLQRLIKAFPTRVYDYHS